MGEAKVLKRVPRQANPKQTRPKIRRTGKDMSKNRVNCGAQIILNSSSE